MWKVEPNDILRFQGKAGDFTEFVDALIESEMREQDVFLSSLWSNGRFFMADGGVDTEVIEPMPSSPMGHFDVPTCWQYKASGFKGMKDSKIRSEIRSEVWKPYSAHLISNNYGYRFCMADYLSAQEKKRWQDLLLEEVHSINKKAPRPQLVDANNLARWACNFRHVVRKFFRGELRNVYALEEWGTTVTKSTKTFIDVPEWHNIKSIVENHVDFGRPGKSAAILVNGDAGVGKTRFVYEILNRISGMRNYVIYTALENVAMDFAVRAVTYPHTRTVIVADECSLRAKVNIQDSLRGYSDRIRAICISNPQERIRSGDPELRLEQMGSDQVKDVLRENFPQVPDERRAQYANWAKGFIRFAADLCDNDPLIVQWGLHKGTFSHREYLEIRLNEKEFLLISALSLFAQVGFLDEKGSELETVCTICNLGEPREIISMAQKLKDAPGFIGIAGRYFYVTPEIIPIAVFEFGWKEWVADNLKPFVKNLPVSLRNAFQKRVLRSAGEEVGRIVGDFFRKWASSVEPVDLADADQAEQMAMLVEMAPKDYLPVLARVLEQGPLEELRLITGRAPVGWGPRRHIVWLLERLAWFPEYFPFAESLLMKLALAESEPNIGNNATAIWKQLFRIYLSGTAVPFDDRIGLLKKRLFSDDNAIVLLSCGALENILRLKAARMETRTVVAGRITPPEWAPANDDELAHCYKLAVELLLDCISDEDAILRQSALKVLTANLRLLLRHGFLSRIEEILTEEKIQEAGVTNVIEELDHFLEYDCREGRFPQKYSQEVRQWLEGLTSGSFHKRLLRVVGKSPWDRSIRNGKDEWQNEINRLVSALCDDAALFEAELPWLLSDEAKSKDLVGRELGRLDTGAKYLTILIQKAIETGSTTLCAAYIYGLTRNSSDQLEVVNQKIDGVEITAPRIAYELFMAGGSLTQDTVRVSRLLDAGVLPIESLRGFLYASAQKTLSSEIFKNFVNRLLKATKSGNRKASGIAMEMVGYRFEDVSEEDKARLFSDSEIVSLIWELLEVTADDCGGEADRFFKILEMLVDLDVKRASKIGSRGLASDDPGVSEEAENFLILTAGRFPHVVMNQIGERMMDRDTRWVFSFEVFRDLFSAIPLEVLKEWLEITGKEGARRVARHLSLPFLDEEGRPVVPDKTAFILDAFEDDDRTFQEFISGSRSFQMYGGDIGSQLKKEIAMARQFLNHPFRRIREWAVYDIERAEREEQRWRIRDEEAMID